MIKVYGIPSCSTVSKARKFFKENDIEVEFINFKNTSVDCTDIDRWLQDIEIQFLFNNRGATYRNLNLKELDLDDEGKREWLCKNNMLCKRPIVEFNSKSLVGFDEEKYKELFL